MDMRAYQFQRHLLRGSSDAAKEIDLVKGLARTLRFITDEAAKRGYSLEELASLDAENGD